PVARRAARPVERRSGSLRLSATSCGPSCTSSARRTPVEARPQTHSSPRCPRTHPRGDVSGCEPARYGGRVQTYRERWQLERGSTALGSEGQSCPRTVGDRETLHQTRPKQRLPKGHPGSNCVRCRSEWPPRCLASTTRWARCEGEVLDDSMRRATASTR